MKRRIVMLGCAAGAVLTLTAATRGGWLVATVDVLPEHLVAGKAVEIPFTLRQHGEEPMNDRKPSVIVREGKQMTRVTASRTRVSGQYAARFAPTSTGDVVLTIDPDFGNQSLTLLPLRAHAAGTATPAALTGSQRGRQLFVAKGCVTCHVNNALENTGTVKAGPDLTGKRFAVDYLKQFLADPSIKPPTNPNQRMPDLNLKPAEIAALVAFINDSKVAGR